MVRLKMHPYTWDQHVEHCDDIVRPGNLIAIEDKGAGGLEMRSNTNTTWEDVSMCCRALAWAEPELGEDRFVRWRSTRRRDTNR